MKDLIYNLKEVMEFANTVLSPLQNDEVYQLLLMTRKQYCDQSLVDEVLAREIIRTNDENKFISKIRKISRMDGIYLNRENGNLISLDCCGIYILIDPRSTVDAYSDFVSGMQDIVSDYIRSGNKENIQSFRMMDIKLHTSIQKNRSRDIYFVADIDDKDEKLLYEVSDILEGNITWISETNGGYHIIVNRNKDSAKKMYTKVCNIHNVDILNDPMSVVPGTLQGRFEVKGIKRELWNNKFGENNGM